MNNNFILLQEPTRTKLTYKLKPTVQSVQEDLTVRQLVLQLQLASAMRVSAIISSILFYT